MADKVRCDSCGRYLDATLMYYENEPEIICQDCAEKAEMKKIIMRMDEKDYSDAD